MNPLWQQLIDFLKTASPIVWQSLIRQVYSDATVQLTWGILTGIISFVLVKFSGAVKTSILPSSLVVISSAVSNTSCIILSSLI